MTTHVVVGGQFGSEAKGHVAAQLVNRAIPHRLNTCVRVGGPNAGHSVVDHDGRTWAFRTIPVAAPISTFDLVIAAGSEIEISVLAAECEALAAAGHDIAPRLYIDEQATILDTMHQFIEKNDGYVERFGSTGKGIGAARADRLARTALLARDRQKELSQYGTICDTAEILQERCNTEAETVIEGTQGFGLGLHAGYYPYCTSGDCRAIDFLAQAGISPVKHVTWVVFRTFPIRVAGNSGPMFGEISWDILSDITDGYIKPELTTVTRKTRRVGQWDHELARRALAANGGVDNPRLRPVLMFVDYLDPTLAGKTSEQDLADSSALSIIEEWESDLGVRFRAVGTGPSSMIWRYSNGTW